MDKEAAIKLSKDYLIKVRKSEIEISEAWLFGSFARGNNHENSDIDLAIVLLKNNKTFETEVKLMTLRTGEETLIEPHAFNKDEFEMNSPLVYQILQSGFRLIF
jgi:predicted nucleotidyltransferase